MFLVELASPGSPRRNTNKGYWGYCQWLRAKASDFANGNEERSMVGVETSNSTLFENFVEFFPRVWQLAARHWAAGGCPTL
ncbi:hypothetical protein QG37_01519 [Candidozyma auris]|uniref:Uncharacterized protein n=1 Tax=Candidozyma auris TaxID=498019 RepID=A0A0L0P4Z8_CANAR|nr:hypothetical protein QG37_01519 [[Candida] auris]